MTDLHQAMPLSTLSLARALGRSPDCVKLLDRAGRLVWMNPEGLCAMEIDDFAPLKQRVWANMWPEADQPEIAALLPAAEAHGAATFSGFCPTARGTPRWWDVTVHPLNDEGGELTGYISISRDVTLRENQRVIQETLVAEMRHRLKNSYALVGGLLGALSRGDPALSSFARDVQRRLGALAEAQSLFAAPDSLAPLDRLLQQIVAPFLHRDDLSITVVAGEGLMADRRTADAVALAIGEFGVNSAKYGAVQHGGRIEIAAQIDDGALIVAWTERSLAPVRATSREGGQGLDLIRRILMANNAVLSLEWQDDGLVARISFPAGFCHEPAT